MVTSRTRQISKRIEQVKKLFLLLLAVPIILAAAASSAQAEMNQIYEACQTLGGEYEERRTDCDPECKTTYICSFNEGWSHVCDDQGVCNQVQDSSSGNMPGASESSQQESSDSDDDYGSDDSDSDQSDGECEVCVDLCEDACDSFRQSWRRDSCLEGCKSRCDYVCD